MERKGSRRQAISFLVCLFLLASMAGAGSVEAYTPADVERLWQTRQCPNCDLSGAVLVSTDLSGANLSGANLSGAYLFLTNLSKANLRLANLTGANLINACLSGAILTRTNLGGADLTHANLEGAWAFGANLRSACLINANLRDAKFDATTWTDGSKCGTASIGRCITTPPTPKPVQPNCPDPTNCRLPDDPPAGSGTLAMMYYIVYEGENLLTVVETKETTATVPDGILRYGRTYTYYVLSISTADEIMDFQGPVTFTVGPKPDKEDDYGNALAGQILMDAQGKTITLADKKLSTLIAAGSGVLSQAAALSALQSTGGVVTDPNGNTVTMNTNDVHVARTNGGTNSPFVMAASDTNTIGTIKPLTASGYTVDVDGKMKTSPDVAIAFSNVNLPFGLFDFNVLLGDYTNRAEVVIVAPVPFAAGTKWYKLASDGTVKEYPKFAVDANGNGILTLYDNDEWDKNPAWGIIRDPGGPGTPAAAGGGGGCFIATAAFGSYLHACVKVLRMFRDTVLLSSSVGSSFVRWYYRVSPPIADVIARHSLAKAGVRLMLLPAVGCALLCLKIGVVPTILLLLLFIVSAGAAVLSKRLRNGRVVCGR